MPRFVYQAKDRALQVVEGTIDAESQPAAIARLGSAGVYPLMIREVSADHAEPVHSARRRVPSRVLAYTSRQLADLLGGGLSLFQALHLLAQQTEHRPLQRVVQEVAAAVRDGQAFSAALARYPDVFPPLYVSMVRAGEAGGALDAVLVRLADVTENEAELRSRMASAFVYPSVVLVIGCATVIVLLTYVVPKLMELFAETGQVLPLPTRLLLATSDALRGWWWAWLGGLAVAAWGAKLARRSRVGRAFLDRLLLRLPVGGELVRKLHTARFARNLGVMIGQGVPMLQAIDVAASTMSNLVFRQATQRVREQVQGGASLSKSLSASGQFPTFVCNMVAVGEESGTLDAALQKVASGYERETDRTLQLLTTLLEPALIVLVGLVVMFIVIAILLPILQLEMIAQ